MDLIRLLIAGIPAPLTSDIVAQLAQLRADVELVARSVSRAELHRAVETFRPDVVVLALGEGEVPEVCTRLQDAFPNVGVVGLVDGARRAALQLSEVGVDDLLEMIRVARRRTNATRGSRGMRRRARGELPGGAR